MGEAKWTEEQKKVIDLRERNILVSAAAGSGKTAVLVERIISMITEESNGQPPKDIDKLLVVTFTKAAAAEMRARIGVALERKLQETPENAHIQKQVSLLHSAQITTIDSFCQSLIKNYFHVIGLDPGFRVADQNDLELMQADVLKELLEEKYEQAMAEGDTGFLSFTDVFSTGRTDKAIEEVVLSLYKIATSWPSPKRWIEACNENYSSTTVEELEQMPWVKKLCQNIRRVLEEYLRLAKLARQLCMQDAGPQGYLPSIESDIAYLERLQGEKTYVQYYDIMSVYQPAKLKAVRSKEVDKKLKESVQSYRKKYLEKGIAVLIAKYFFQTPQEMVEDIRAMASPVRQLLQLTADFADAFQKKKQEENVVDFSDMEHYALQILLNEGEDGEYVPSETACELQNYYEEILTDEYQDSNYVQELLLTSLCRAPLQKPYLFMVGDVKQSIYKFRLARPDLFLRKYETYTQKDSPMQRIDLRKNFRSRASVLESANYIFEKIMRKSLGGIEYTEDVKLVSGADFGTSEKRTAEKTQILLAETKVQDAFLDKRTIEAVMIGNEIRKLVQGDNPMHIKEGEEFRPVRYRDIAILLRSTAGWSEEFVQVFTDMGIPAYAETKTGYFTSLEVEGVLNYLHVIDNPRQDIELVSVLRSGIGRITDEELAWIGTLPEAMNFWDKVQMFSDYCCWKEAKNGEKTAEKKESYQKRGFDFEKIEKELTMPEEQRMALYEKLSVFRKQVEKYQELSKYKSVFELLRMIYDETKYYALMTAMPAGEKRKANLDILLQQSVEFEKNGHKGIFGFLRYIQNLKKSNVDFGAASTISEGMDAVRIMTIHKSKGLEFPVAFVAGLGKQFNFQDARKSVIIDGDYGVGCDFVDLSLRLKQPTLVKRFMANEIILGTLAEEVRVLYVALTRAKEQLYLCGGADNLPKKLQDWIVQSTMINFSQLSGALTYLDWILPAVLTRKGICMDLREALECSAGEESFLCGSEDTMFSLSVHLWEDIFEKEKTKLAREILDEDGLYAWDTKAVYDEAMHRTIKRKTEYIYPYQADAGLPVKISVSELKRRSTQQAEIAENGFVAVAFETEDKEKDFPIPSFLQETHEISGAARGTLYHLVMEHFPYQLMQESKNIWTEKEFRNYLKQMVSKGYMTEEESHLLKAEKFVRFAQSSIGKRMARAKKQAALKLEQPFMLDIAAKEIYPESSSEATIIVQGIIDAYFFEEDHIVLVDYKTDYVKKDASDLVKKYQVQLEYYAQALERLTGKQVTEKIIYSFWLNEEIRV